MIKGIGIDLTEISRFSNLSEDFLKQVFNNQEIKTIRNNPLLSSINFCLKESILKAFGKGLYFGFFWHRIKLGNNRINVSKSLRQGLSNRYVIHACADNSKKYACAITIIEDKQEVF
ncbi:MAG: 4'-phosphopantetheinyl transferase superfamily protein [candidate division WOR-3 bacterium]